MNAAIVFPGQGSQFAGMADAWTTHDAARAVLDDATEAIGRDVVEGCRDEEALETTEFVQPAILACDVAAFRVLDALGLAFVGTAGHSLGEFAALVAADVLALEDALRVVAVRGRAMRAAGEARPGTMAALLGVGAADAAALCDEAREGDVLLVANENSPQQVVISGSVAGDRAGGGARRRPQDPRRAPQGRRRLPLAADGDRGRPCPPRSTSGVRRPRVPHRVERHRGGRRRTGRAPRAREASRRLPRAVGGAAARRSEHWAPTRSPRRDPATCSRSSPSASCLGPERWRSDRPRPPRRSPGREPDRRHPVARPAGRVEPHPRAISSTARGGRRAPPEGDP